MSNHETALTLNALIQIANQDCYECSCRTCCAARLPETTKAVGLPVEAPAPSQPTMNLTVEPRYATSCSCSKCNGVFIGRDHADFVAHVESRKQAAQPVASPTPEESDRQKFRDKLEPWLAAQFEADDFLENLPDHPAHKAGVLEYPPLGKGGMAKLMAAFALEYSAAQSEAREKAEARLAEQTVRVRELEKERNDLAKEVGSAQAWGENIGRDRTRHSFRCKYCHMPLVFTEHPNGGGVLEYEHHLKTCAKSEFSQLMRQADVLASSLRDVQETPPEELAKKFHEAYERLAPGFGYETRKESAKPWADVPENNRKLMTAVCAEVLSALLTRLEDTA